MTFHKKVCSFATIITIMIVAIFVPSLPGKAVHSVWVEVTNPRPGANSEYKFHFTIQNKVRVHEFISFVFPKGFSYKKTITGNVDWKKPDFNIPIINDNEDGSFRFAFNSTIELDPSKEGYQNITVTIPKYQEIIGNVSGARYEFQFFNPPTPGLYTFQVYTQSELDPINSQPVEIKDCPMSNPLVSVEPGLVNEPAGYNIDFDLNENIKMIANQDTIQIQFPPECKLNKEASLLRPEWVLINDSFLERIPTFRDNVLTMVIPKDIRSLEHVAIQLDSRIGIVNPSKPGIYEIKVKISADDKWYRSFPYYVETEPDPALLLVEPAIPSEVAEYSIAHTGERVELKPLDFIYVRFPDTIKLPTTMDAEGIRVNNKPIFAVSLEGQVVAIQLKSYAKGWMPLEINFTRECGVKTPASMEPFRLEIKLEKEGDYLPTNEVKMDQVTLVVVETFTAIWALGCIHAMYAMDTLNEELGPHRVAMINYYVDSTDDYPFPRLSCLESEDRMKWYMEDKGIPNTFFNGNNFIKGIPNLEDDSVESKRKALKAAFAKKIKEVNLVPPPITISGCCTYVENNTFRVTIDIQRIGAIPFNNPELITALTESNIPYVAINSDTMHYFVLREFLKPKEIKETTGIPINLAVAGGHFKTEFTFELNTELYKNELNLIFFVQDMTQKKILQGLTIPLQKK